MRTVVESPQARFRREAGLGPISRSRVGAGDWMRLNTGDRVREREGRHVGRVQAIHWSRIVVVQWEDSGWLSELRLEEIERLGKED